MPNGALERRKKNQVATKPGQLLGMGVIAPDTDKEGNKVKLQPTVLQRPNALAARAMAQGNVGMSIPKAGLADQAIQANQAPANITESGQSNSILNAGNIQNAKKKKKPNKVY